MKSRTLALTVLLFGIGAAQGYGHEGSRNDYLNFVKEKAAALRFGDEAPGGVEAWQEQRTELRNKLRSAWGEFPEPPAPLKPRKLGELVRDGYRVEKIVFQTLPDVWMTANAYVPDRAGKLPALLMVHGHWRGAKQDPVVQARCIGAARLGFFVLVVDAFGAGERGVGRALGEYHGEMTAATLLPTGMPLSGLQVYENMRAVDYLLTRPEVDAERIGITGASGGGNQTMYAAAWDERFRAAAPVCSVGNYQAYLGAACCLCEVVPGALRFTEEWAVLGMVAPRALLVINATKDSRQFSVEEARYSLEHTAPVFRLLQKPEHLRHTIFESGHDYSEPMREAVYGWMSFHLKGEGDGGPIDEPEIATEEPETLRCYPGEFRPEDWLTVPKFAAREGRKLLAARKAPATARQLEAAKVRLRAVLIENLFGGFPEKEDLHLQISTSDDGKTRELNFTPEEGIHLTAIHQQGTKPDRLCIILDLEGARSAAVREAAKEANVAGSAVVTMDLRATGSLAWPSDKIGRAPDHTTAEWGLWIGRPLLGQWAWDIRRLLDAMEEADGKLPSSVEVIGIGPAGILAMTAASLDERITGVSCKGTLASFISETPYEGQRLGTIVPGILKHLGDIAHLAALVAPVPLEINGAVGGDNQPITRQELERIYEPARQAYSIFSAESQLRLSASDR